MPDCVVDASVIALANGDIRGRRPGNVPDRRLAVISLVANGTRRLRYNSKILGEYNQIVKEFRNDVIESLFALLDDTRRSVLKQKLCHLDIAISRKKSATGRRTTDIYWQRPSVATIR